MKTPDSNMGHLTIPSTNTKARLDPLVRRVTGQYLAYQLSPPEYVTTLSMDTQDARGWVLAQGYEPAPTFGPFDLEAAKRHPEDRSHLHAFALRKRPRSIPAAQISGTGLDDYHTRQLQYHVHGFETTDGVELYSHLEAAPDVRRVADESYGGMRRRLHTHYKTTWDRDRHERSTWTYLRGATDLDV